MNCPFCIEYLNPIESQFYHEIGCKIGCKSRILLETENWYVIPTIGCLTVGYVLLVTKQHYLSLANLNDKLFFEMLDLKQGIEKVLFKKLGMRCLAFEHGTANTISKGANSVKHLHVHLLPYTRPIWSSIVSDIPKINFEIIESYENLYFDWRMKPPKSYLLFQDLNEKLYYIANANKMPSQLFRKCLAPHLGVKFWDWKKEYYLDNLVSTMKLFK